jgi:nucleoside-diphosphate-sugar epimerase
VTILVTGATGVLGTLVADEVRTRGLAVRTAARSGCDMPVDLVSGAGLEAAVCGVDVVIHCATSPRHHRRVDLPAPVACWMRPERRWCSRASSAVT